MKHLSVAGAELAYEVGGTGSSTLAFVHGWLSQSAHWDAQATHFASDHRVVRWDRRGMGQSAAGPAAESARRHADDLAAILDHEEIERVVVLGHAGGGPTALTFAASYPDRTEGLVMVDSYVRAPSRNAESDPFVATVDGLIAGLEAEDGKEFLAPVYASFFGPLAPPDLVEAAIANAQATDTAVAVSELRHILGDTSSVAAQVRCPVLSVSVDATDTSTIQSTFADVEVGHVVGAGHFLQLEVPDQFNAMVATFLARL
ncbi:MAG: alpha/beta hydrolase [Acidimicrobiia bacterium]|nr:alpha/beta hydrolase [Acidimicrobiia bacterium]